MQTHRKSLLSIRTTTAEGFEIAFKEMLRRILEAEERAIRDYNERIKQAEAYGDTGLKVALENQVSDETNHQHEVSRMLAGWPD